MNEKEIKRSLEDKGLRVADLARDMSKEFDVSEKNADVMLRQLISGARWYPRYADWLSDKYGIVVNRPQWLRPVRERLKAA